MRSWTLDARGLPLRVWELSDEHDGQPIVALHGWLDQGLGFAPVAAGRPGRWLAMDQRGHGGSGHVGGGGYYHFPDYLADLDALVERLGGPVRLVGHSMGGTVASMYAGARPDRVSALVVVEGLGALEMSDPSYLKRARMFLEGLRAPPAPVRLRGLEDAAQRMVRRHPGLDLDHARLLAEHGTIEDAGGLRWAFDPLHLTRAPYPFREEFYAEFLGAITAPTLVVWAEESWYPAEVQARRAAAIAGAEQRVLPGTHMLPYTSGPALGALIEDFFARLPPTSGYAETQEGA